MSTSQLMLLATIPKVSGTFSLLGSFAVIYDVARDEKKRQTTYHRLMLGVSISDLLSSVAFIMGTWAMPKGSTSGALGTVGTCDFFGFIGQVGTLSAALYNVVLATYYVLMLKFRWSSTKLKQRAEPWFHAFAILCAISVGITASVKRLFGAAIYVCW